jgi:hypothetical protein
VKEAVQFCKLRRLSLSKKGLILTKGFIYTIVSVIKEEAASERQALPHPVAKFIVPD